MHDLRDRMLEEIATSQRVVRGGDEVVPRFRIFAPDGEHVAFVQLGKYLADRMRRFNVMRDFMIWKAASGFILSSELAEPDALFIAAVTRSEILGAIQPIRREPIGFKKVRWIPAEQIDDTIIALLPPKALAVTRDELTFMQRAFEDDGVPGITWQTSSAMRSG